MNVLRRAQSSLGWKLFLSYLVVILAALLVLAGTAELLMPAAFQPHVAEMEARIGNQPALVADLYQSVGTAFNELLAVAIVAAILSAVVVSAFISSRITQPMQRMMAASQRIAAGDYHQRVGPLGRDELGALAESLDRMAGTLEATEMRRTDLLADVAHELRTPLAGIRSTMEGLIDGVLPADPETFLRVERETTRLQRLVRDLEDLSRAEAGQVVLDRRAVDPAELVKTAADRLALQYEDKGVQLSLEVPPGLPEVLADANRITQVLINLLGNALQYTGEGGWVTVRVRRADGLVAFAVTDSGIGIPEEHLPHIFERFYRVDRSRSRAGGGSGIGLTIARHLVEAHGGEIWAESAGSGQGSSFSFTLPIASHEAFPLAQR